MVSTARKYVMLPLVVSVIVLADQLSKRWVMAHLPFGQPWNPVQFLRPVVTLTYVTNDGIAFGLLQGWGNRFAGVAFVAIAGILAYYVRQSLGRWLVELSLGLVLGGTIGNLLDRLTYDGHVIDFIDFGIWPVFNIADSAVFIGMILLAYHLWQDRESSG